MRFLPRIHIAMPVLGKELIEQSQRKRTYVLRLLYAVALFGISLVVFRVMMMEFSDSPVDMLGTGRYMFDFLFWVQIGGIYLLLPAMLCGSITVEKERNTLMLLMLSRLRPWEIVLQKLLSRLFVIGTYVLLNLPLLAIAYTFGGVSTEQLFLAGYTLALTALQVGSFAILCSCFFRTTAVAFIASYVGLGIFYAALPLYLEAAAEFRFWPGRINDDYYGILVAPFSYFFFVTDAWWTPPSPINWMIRESFGYEWFTGWIAILIQKYPRIAYALDFVIFSAPAAISALVFLVMARLFVTRRAMLRPVNPLLIFFRLLDRIFGWANRTFAGGIEIIKSRKSLPDEKPVAWLEKTRRAIARPHYLIRIFVFTSIPTIFISVLIMRFMLNPRDGYEMFTGMVLLVWPPLVLFLAILGAGTFSAERANQTLDVLVTTPLSTQQILREKLSALWRFAAVIALPLVILLACDFWMRVELGQWMPAYHKAQVWNSQTRAMSETEMIYRINVGAFGYLIFTLLAMAIYIPLVIWMSVWLGMWMKTRTKAAIASVVTLLGICVTPFLLVVPFVVYRAVTLQADPSDEWFIEIMMLSPLTMIPMLEFDELMFPQAPLARAGGPWLIFSLHFFIFGTLTLWIRHLCYSRADKLLGRMVPP